VESRTLEAETESENETSVIPVDDRVAVGRCDDVEDLSALADNDLVDLAAVVADAGVDLDVAAGGVFLAAADGCC